MLRDDDAYQAAIEALARALRDDSRCQGMPGSIAGDVLDAEWAELPEMRRDVWRRRAEPVYAAAGELIAEAEYPTLREKLLPEVRRELLEHGVNPELIS